MAHFAKLGPNDEVLEVLVVHNTELLDENGVEQEHLGVAFLQQIFGGDWVQTSYNNNVRKNFAAKGYTYDSERDAFIPPQPFNSWLLIEDTCLWEPPTPYPTDGADYTWDEGTTSWVVVEE